MVARECDTVLGVQDALRVIEIHSLIVTDWCGVKHVNAFKYYALGYSVDQLKIVREGTAFNADAIHTMVSSMDTLMRFRGEEDPVRLHSSIEAADALLTELRNLIESFVPHPDAVPRQPAFSAREQLAIARAVIHLQSMLDKELGDMPTFSVEGKGNLDIRRLIVGASDGCPVKTKAKLSVEGSAEIDESGKCLAFDRGTASAFHILRALEIVTKDYIGKTGLPLPPQNRCNWGEYIKILKDNNQPKEIADLIQIIKDNYRNPIMHPDDSVTMDDAVGLFNLCLAAIDAICNHTP